MRAVGAAGAAPAAADDAPVWVSVSGLGGEGGCEAADRRVLVDVLHRHRRQVVTFAHPGAETGHQHRVGAEVVEEVGCRPTRARRPRCRPAPPRTAARIRRSGQIASRTRGRDVAGQGGCKAPDRRVLVDVLHRHRRQVRRACAPARRSGPSASSRRRGRRRSCCRPTRARCPRCRPAPPRTAARIRRSGRIASRTRGRDVAGQGRCEAPDRRVLVDVLHRHRRQVVPLAHPRAEAGHQHRVGAEVVEEVAVDRHVLGAHDAGQHLREAARTRPGDSSAQRDQ